MAALLAGCGCAKKPNALTPAEEAQARDLPVAIRDYKATGWPWDPKDLVSNKPVNPADDAAPLIKMAASLIPRSAPIDLGERPKEGHFDEYKKELDSCKAALDQGVLASNKRILSWGHLDYDSRPPDEVFSAQHLARVFCKRAVVRAHFGDARGACQDLQTAWRFAKLLGQTPVLVGADTGFAVEYIMLVAYQLSAAELKGNVPALQKLIKCIQTCGPPSAADLENVVRGEACMSISVARLGGPDVLDGSQGLSGDGALDQARALADQWIRADVQRADLFTKERGNMAAIRAQMLLLDPTDPFAFGRDTEHPSDAGIVVPFINAAAQLALTKCFLNAMLVQAQTGHFPAAVSEIPGTWVDPIDGKPLRLKANGDSIRIYSVGQDAKDDGGKDRSEVDENAKSGFDIVAAYPPIPPPKPKKSTYIQNLSRAYSRDVLQGPQ